MNKKLVLLAGRREQLVYRIAQQRLDVRQSAEPWIMPLARVDQGLEALRYLQGHPSIIVGVGILFLALRPGRRRPWLENAWIAWQIMHGLKKSERLSVAKIGHR